MLIKSIVNDLCRPLCTDIFGAVASWTTPIDIPAAEAAALKAFFDATGGTGWTNSTGWGTSATAASYQGVTVTAGHVTAISLPANNLTGAAGTTLDPLAATLATLDLEGNAFDYDWYVDSVNGSDLNSGTQPDQALQTIAALSAKPIVSGQKIGLARGSLWREQLTITTDDLTIDAFGSGDKPILDCADIVSAGWSKTDGYTNIYQVTLTTNYVVSQPAFCSVWEGPARLPASISLAALDTAPGTYYVETSNTTTPTVYIHATGSGDPSSNGKVYEMATRLSGIYAKGADSGTVRNVVCKRNLANNGAIQVGRSWHIEDVLASDGSKHNLLYGDGCTLSLVVASGAYYTASATMFVYNEDVPASLGVTHNFCQATLPSYGALFCGFHGHKNTSGDFGDVVFNSCVVSNVFQGFLCNDADISINNTTASCKYLIQTGAPTQYIVNGGTYTNIGETPRIISFESNNASVSLQNLTMTLNNMASGGMFYSTKEGTSLSLVGCTINYNTNAIWVAYFTGAGCNLTANGNRFNVNRSLHFYVPTDATISSDNNSFAYATPNFTVGATTYKTLAEWQAGTGQDTNSTISPYVAP